MDYIKIDSNMNVLSYLLDTKYIVPSLLGKVNYIFDYCKREYYIRLAEFYRDVYNKPVNMDVVLSKPMEEVHNSIKTVLENQIRFEDLDRVKDLRITIDIRGCKFNSGMYTKITDYCMYINFIDSENEYINNILKHNDNILIEERRLKEDTSIETVIIRSDIDFNGFMELVKPINPLVPDYDENFIKNKIYRLESNDELGTRLNKVSILTVILMMYMNPDVVVDLNGHYEEFCRMFRSYWKYRGIHRESYNLLWQRSNFMKIDSIPGEENMFYIPGVGKVNEDILHQSYIVIPYDFGTKSSYELRKDKELGDYYVDEDSNVTKSFWNDVTKTLDNLLSNNSKKEKSLYNFLTKGLEVSE